MTSKNGHREQRRMTVTINQNKTNQKLSKAIIACQNETGVILWAEGPIAELRGKYPPYELLTMESYGLEGAPSGLSLWVGKFEDYKENHGTYHPLGPKEWEVLKKISIKQPKQRRILPMTQEEKEELARQLDAMSDD